MTLTSTPTTFHIHIPVRVLLGYGDRRLGEIVTHPEGVEGARKELREMLEDGAIYLVCDSKCDNRKPDGSCAGHTEKEA
ncbi:hypothetical protein L0636_01210 [Halomonas janggokensis]|uniref:Uncharacterized protein n=1 Tax=Vreelandella janggokensis TaxID=370767 RepID=A0ABT4IS63_9GAMM|nr:hypothetical protein [Halomonas janggokensis]MCZ0926507.1 hypothetical protein [Halomonas janggokensis]MCZ0929045.1 hypothetical protein [Halomonas janggokensis]